MPTDFSVLVESLYKLVLCLFLDKNKATVTAENVTEYSSDLAAATNHSAEIDAGGLVAVAQALENILAVGQPTEEVSNLSAWLCVRSFVCFLIICLPFTGYSISCKVKIILTRKYRLDSWSVMSSSSSNSGRGLSNNFFFKHHSQKIMSSDI